MNVQFLDVHFECTLLGRELKLYYFYRSTILGCTFSGCRFFGCKFSECKISECKFSGCITLSKHFWEVAVVLKANNISVRSSCLYLFLSDKNILSLNFFFNLVNLESISFIHIKWYLFLPKFYFLLFSRKGTDSFLKIFSS